MDDLWKRFIVINLNKNHRQGDNNEYANLLNRVRIGQQTAADIEKLRTRVFKKGDKRIPEKALYISGTNEEVNKINNRRLSMLEEKEVTITALVYSETKKDFKPNIDKK